MNYKQGLVISVYVDSDLLRRIYVTQVADVISKLSLGYMEDGGLSVCVSLHLSMRNIYSVYNGCMWHDTTQQKKITSTLTNRDSVNRQNQTEIKSSYFHIKRNSNYSVQNNVC